MTDLAVEGGSGEVAPKWVWWGRNERLRGLRERSNLSGTVQGTGCTGDASFRDKGALREARWMREMFRDKKKRKDRTHWLAMGDESQTCFSILGTLYYLVVA